MPSKKSSSSAPARQNKCGCFSFRKLGFLAVILALLSSIVVYLEARLESFYIFSPDHLHDLSQRAIAAHGNDTRAVAHYIVAELNEKETSAHLNLDEEWVFNNAGGAMGAMWIIHASKCPLQKSWLNWTQFWKGNWC